MSLLIIIVVHECIQSAFGGHRNFFDALNYSILNKTIDFASRENGQYKKKTIQTQVGSIKRTSLSNSIMFLVI